MDGQAGDFTTEVSVTPEMIDAGVSILRREFGGETEGRNRYVDFAETVRALLQTALAAS